MGKMYEEILTTLVLAPVALSSDGYAASDNTNGVSIKGMDSVDFILAVGAGATVTAAIPFTVQYSSTGSASDASGSTTVWASSDAAFTSVDSDGVSEVYILSIDLEQKGLADEAGKLFVALAAGEYSSVPACIIAQSRPMSAGLLPVSQENTVVAAVARA